MSTKFGICILLRQWPREVHIVYQFRFTPWESVNKQWVGRVKKTHVTLIPTVADSFPRVGDRKGGLKWTQVTWFTFSRPLIRLTGQVPGLRVNGTHMSVLEAGQNHTESRFCVSVGCEILRCNSVASVWNSMVFICSNIYTFWGPKAQTLGNRVLDIARIARLGQDMSLITFSILWFIWIWFHEYTCPLQEWIGQESVSWLALVDNV